MGLGVGRPRRLGNAVKRRLTTVARPPYPTAVSPHPGAAGHPSLSGEGSSSLLHLLKCFSTVWKSFFCYRTIPVYVNGDSARNSCFTASEIVNSSMNDAMVASEMASPVRVNSFKAS